MSISLGKNGQKMTKKNKILWRRFFLPTFWFFTGFSLSGFLLASLVLILVRNSYKDRVYQGVFIEGVDMGGKTRTEVEEFFKEKNKTIETNSFIFTYDSLASTASAQELALGYNAKLLSDQAFLVGKSGNPVSDTSVVLYAILHGVMLKPSYYYSTDKLDSLLEPLRAVAEKDTQDALFTIQNNRVIAFRESSDGQVIDKEMLNSILAKEVVRFTKEANPHTIEIPLPIKTLKPKITTEETNNLGIVELIGEGKSYFSGSIPNRIHNITLASSKVNGILIPPDEIFSFNAALGDVSKFTGYKEAYIIKEGRTILGDGGGVCQVSTTLFRAVLNTGLPIIERHAHAYRVGYYEQNSPPGLDATVFAPSIDFRFKNDTGSHVLIQSAADPINLTLTFSLYGKRDGRQILLSPPLIKNQISPPPPLYQDDPTLQKDVVKQIEHPAWGALVTFSRTVKKNNVELFSDNFSSRYTPWQAVYLKGTKE